MMKTEKDKIKELIGKKIIDGYYKHNGCDNRWTIVFDDKTKLVVAGEDHEVVFDLEVIKK